jgi:hypothetical protein
MTSRALSLLFLALLVSTGFTSCKHTIQAQRFYAPPARPATEVARMWNGQNSYIKVLTVDGQPVKQSFLSATVLEVLPGAHLVNVKSNADSGDTLTWHAEAGKEYEPVVLQTAAQRATPGVRQSGTPAIVPALSKRFLVNVE